MQLSRKRSRKRSIVAAIGVLIMLGVASAFAYQYGWIPGINQGSNVIDGVNYDKATNEQKSAGEDAKKDFIDKNYDNNQKASKDTDTQANNIDITITNHGSANGVYQFRTMISTTETDGSCTLKLTSNGRQDISKTIGVQVLGSYAVCAGYFDIPVSQLSGTTWKADISYKSSQGAGQASTTVKVD